MSEATALRTGSINAEDMQVGYRYWEVRPGFESNWTIAKVEIHTTEYTVWRNGGEYTLELVTVTRRDGNVRIFEKGETVAIMGPFRAETGWNSQAHADAEAALLKCPCQMHLDALRKASAPAV
jgi:hypothetical protein